MDYEVNKTKLSDLNEDCFTCIFRYLPLKDKVNLSKVCVDWINYDQNRIWKISKLFIKGYETNNRYYDSDKTLNLSELRNILLFCGPLLRVFHIYFFSNSPESPVRQASFDGTLYRIFGEHDYEELFDILIETCCNLKEIGVDGYCETMFTHQKIFDLLQANQKLEVLNLDRHDWAENSCIGSENMMSRLNEYLSSNNGKLTELRITGDLQFNDRFFLLLAANMRKLRVLDLYCSLIELIEEDSLKAIKKLSTLENLEELLISGFSSLTDETISAISSGCKKLEKISVRHCSKITTEGFNVLVSALPNLKTLELGFCKAMPISHENAQSNLRDLSIEFDNKVEEIPSMIKGFKHLEKLALDDSSSIISDGHLLAMASSCKQLRKFKLISWSRSVTENGIHAFLTALPNLVTLYLTVKGFESFLYGGKNSKLQNLILCGVDVSADTSKNISFKNLKELSIINPRISDDVITAISFGCKKLETLELRKYGICYDRISTTTIDALLTNLPNLETLVLAKIEFNEPCQSEKPLDVNLRNVESNLRNLKIQYCEGYLSEAIQKWILMSPRLKTLMSGEEYDSEMDYSDSDCGDTGYEDYYSVQPWGGDPDNDIDLDHNRRDPEYALYDCLRIDEVERLLNENVEALSNSLHITPSLAKVLLQAHNWALHDIITKYRANPSSLMINSKIKPLHAPDAASSSKPQRGGVCLICITFLPTEKFATLTCGHSFCKECWCMHFEVQIMQGISTGISCMARDCDVLAPEDFVLSLLIKPSMRERYQQFTFHDYIKSHPQLRFCPGPNCQIVMRSKELRAKRVMCSSCKSIFCFRCGMEYHAPTDCNTIRKWLTKCADDSETANYISAHTKDCPKCHICIEKNGGCNHMQCYNCKHEFCWMCLGDWKAHGSEYYECSRYKENPNIAHESVHAQAREALKKYLHYYERWENHSKSLKLEEQTLEGIKMRINKKVMNSSGTWIDWQHLFEAASLLARCRYTLQYTYPYAYYMEPGPRKELFEYQQAQLEAEIENLSWKIERAETTDRGDLENQMDIAEKRRVTLLKDFLESNKSVAMIR